MVDALGALGAAVAGLAPGSLDCYVQLPVQVAPRGNAVIDRVRNFLEDGLLARFTAASTILPALSDDGRVILVGGNTPGEASAPDDQSARLALLDVLAHAIQADRSTTRIRIRRLPNTESAEQIAASGPGRRADPRGGAGRPAGPRTEDELRRLADRGHGAGQRPVLTPPENCSTKTIDKVAYTAP